MLSDTEIVGALESGRLEIVPPPRVEHIQPCSVDLTMGLQARQYIGSTTVSWASRADPMTQVRRLTNRDCVVIPPGRFALLTTAERVCLPADLVGVLHGKSTWGRLGLQVHVTAGLIDPGFRGQITLEAVNVGPLSLKICPGDPIAQLTFDQLAVPAGRPYGTEGLSSHYQDQVGAVAPRKWSQP
jgi:dCTP deaminase